MNGVSRSLVHDAPQPTLLTDFDGDWHYYVPGHDTEELLQVDELDVLEWQAVWMQPIQASAVDPEERPEDFDTVRRDENGRFQPTYLWFTCGAKAPGAQPFLAVRYKP